jgi:sRNA-binding carbon storage regulator CsrA
MEISARKQGESVVCELPNGGSIEITMVSTQGDSSRSVADVKEAVKILRKNPQLLSRRG